MNVIDSLMHLGYSPNCDFFARMGGAGYTEIVIDWAPHVQPPSQADIESAKIPAARAAVREAVKLERNRREQAGFDYLGKRIDSDAVAVQRITVAGSVAQMALATGTPYEVQWTCADGSLLTLDAQGVLGMVAALGAHGLALHLHARDLKGLVEASDNPESIDITAGWPG